MGSTSFPLPSMTLIVQHIARDSHVTTLIVDRCLQTYLPKSVSLLLLRAQLLEESGDVEATKQHLEKVMTKDCPQLLEAAIFYVELMLRHEDKDGAEEMMEQLATEGMICLVMTFSPS